MAGTRHQLVLFLVGFVILTILSAGNLLSKSNFSLFQTRKVIAFSLANATLLDSALDNVALANQFFPDWEVHFYLPDNVGQTVQDRLSSVARLIVVSPEDNSYNLPPAYQHYLVALTSDVFILRDVASRLNARDASAVREWLASGRRYHVIRDTPWQAYYPLPKDLWGALGHLELASFFRQHLASLSDQHSEAEFRHSVLWPRLRPDVFQHSAYYCRLWGGKGLPLPRPPGELVGGRWRNGTLHPNDLLNLQVFTTPQLSLLLALEEFSFAG